MIIQRIIGSDPVIVSHLNQIFSMAWFSSDTKPTFGDAMDLFGWPIVREMSLLVLLHEIHKEVAGKAGGLAQAMDRRALSILSGGAELGASSFASLFANIGEAGIALHDANHGHLLLRQQVRSPEEMLATEKQLFGFDHGVLGCYMLGEVDFPSAVCDEVFDHTIVGNPIWVAEQLTADLGFGAKYEQASSSDLLWNRPGFSPQRVERLKTSMLSSGDLPYLAFNDSDTKAA